MDNEVKRLKDALASTDVRSTTYLELLDKLAKVVEIQKRILWYEHDRACVETPTAEPVNYVEKRAESVADILKDPVVEPAPPMVEVPKNVPEVSESETHPITREELRKLLTDTKDRVEKTTIKEILEPYVPEGKTKFSFKDVPESKYEELAEALRNAR